MTRYLLALACICTSAVAGAAGLPSELELALARTPALYLKLDLADRTLVVKVRGMELDRVSVADVRLLIPEGATPGTQTARPLLPVIWRVVREPQEEWRQVVAPPTLVPYREEELPPVPAVTPTPEPERPSQYSVELDNGWLLAIGPTPPTGRVRRAFERLRSGWRRLFGRRQAPAQPTVAVQMSAADARRLLHLFRPGMAILVVDGG